MEKDEARRHRVTHTIVTLEVSHGAYDEIAAHIRHSPGYESSIMEDGTIDMTGIGLVRFGAENVIGVRKPSTRQVTTDVSFVEERLEELGREPHPALHNMGVTDGEPMRPNDPRLGEMLDRKSEQTRAIMNANARQVGGEHYGLTAFQHWDLVVMFDFDYFQAQITKYVMRWRKKNGIEDLKKGQHFLEKYIEEIEAERIIP
jgi:hypothetical protein